MGQITPRRPRGSVEGYKQVNYLIPPDRKELLEEVSRRMNVSAAEGLSQILAHLNLDSDGFPSWFDRDQLPEELPIRKAG